MGGWERQRDREREEAREGGTGREGEERRTSAVPLLVVAIPSDGREKQKDVERRMGEKGQREEKAVLEIVGEREGSMEKEGRKREGRDRHQ